jgi:uncharacterized protein YegP (UPF0339 family)
MDFFIYKDSRNEWRWYLKASNGRKIADSGEGYITKQSCLNGIDLVKSARNASVYELS